MMAELVMQRGAGDVVAVTVDGESEVMARLAPGTIPFSIDWLPDGRLLVIDGPRRLLMRLEPDGGLETVADLTGLGPGPATNSSLTLPAMPT